MKTDKQVIVTGLVGLALAVVVAIIGSKLHNPIVWLVAAVIMLVPAISLARLVLRFLVRSQGASKQ